MAHLGPSPPRLAFRAWAAAPPRRPRDTWYVDAPQPGALPRAVVRSRAAAASTAGVLSAGPRRQAGAAAPHAREAEVWGGQRPHTPLVWPRGPGAAAARPPRRPFARRRGVSAAVCADLATPPRRRPPRPARRAHRPLLRLCLLTPCDSRLPPPPPLPSAAARSGRGVASAAARRLFSRQSAPPRADGRSGPASAAASPNAAALDAHGSVPSRRAARRGRRARSEGRGWPSAAAQAPGLGRSSGVRWRCGACRDGKRGE